MLRRCGVTLIELLAVIVIMLIVTAITVPVIAPAIRGRQVREAARMVDVFISGAKSRAQRTGRSVGVLFELTPGNPSACQQLKYVEVPPPYLGDVASSTVLISGKGWLGGFPQGDIGWLRLVRPGDLISFGYKSKRYRLYAGEQFTDLNGNGACDAGTEPFVDLNGDGLWTPPQPGTLDANGYFATPPTTAAPNWTFAAADSAEGFLEIKAGGIVYGSPSYQAAFQISVRPTVLAAGGLNLPSDTAIDMGWADISQSPVVVYQGSGMDVVNPISVSAASGLDLSANATYAPNPTPGVPPFNQRIIVTFNSAGTVDMVYASAWNGRPANPGWSQWVGCKTTTTIYLLIGEAAKIGGDPTVTTATAAQPRYNFQDENSRIVAINSLSGEIGVERNSAVDLSEPIGIQGWQSRSAAREATSMESR